VISGEDGTDRFYDDHVIPHCLVSSVIEHAITVLCSLIASRAMEDGATASSCDPILLCLRARVNSVSFVESQRYVSTLRVDMLLTVSPGYCRAYTIFRSLGD
jgi:hypothetical protein